MATKKHMTTAEAVVLDAYLPAGLTEEMRDVALCLFEAMVLTDPRAGQVQPDALWRQVLGYMARVAALQLQHLAEQKGGRAIYLAKGVAVHLSERDRRMCEQFRGDYDVLAKRYDLTPMRVRQIVGSWQLEQYRRRQGQLPGLDLENDPKG
jgi:Mor family transcriptional regulator